MTGHIHEIFLYSQHMRNVSDVHLHLKAHGHVFLKLCWHHNLQATPAFFPM